MAEFNRYESAKFTQASDESMDKLTTEVEKSLAANAARGFTTPCGDTLMDILGGVIDAKEAVTEANGKVYDERSGLLFQIDEFALNYLVRLAKYAMELYREQLMNAIALEIAEQAAETERNRADVSRRNSEIEGRMVAIIRNRAEMEARILVYERQLIEAQELTLGAETTLVQDTLATAEKKLEMIDSIYDVLAAEKLVLAAEQRKATALEDVLAAELIVAEIKRQMVPFYVQKANARLELAQATIDEIPTLKAIVELGYDRIELQDAIEAEKHAERAQELELEIAREALTRAAAAEDLAKKQLHRLLVDYSNDIKSLILAQKKQLSKDEVDFRLAAGLAREQVNINIDKLYASHERSNLINEMENILSNMEERALDQQDTVMASADRKSKSHATILFSRRIREGFVVG